MIRYEILRSTMYTAHTVIYPYEALSSDISNIETLQKSCFTHTIHIFMMYLNIISFIRCYRCYLYLQYIQFYPVFINLMMWWHCLHIIENRLSNITPFHGFLYNRINIYIHIMLWKHGALTKGRGTSGLPKKLKCSCRI